MTVKKTFNDLKMEIRAVEGRHGQLSHDNAFSFWFVHAMLTENEAKALESLAGQSRDIGADAILIDEESARVFLVQSKYHTAEQPPQTPSKDVVALAQLGKSVLGPKPGLEPHLRRAAPAVRERLELARRLLLQHRYSPVPLLCQHGSRGL